MKNKKGDFTGLIYLIVSISAFAIFLLIVGYIVPEIATPMKEQIGISSAINDSFDSSTNIAHNTLPSIWLIVFVVLCLGLFITSFLVQTHPVFVPVFIFLLILAVVVSVPLSNAYESLTESATLSSASAYQSAIKFTMTNLPVVTFIMGLLVLIITFAKPGGARETLA